MRTTFKDLQEQVKAMDIGLILIRPDGRSGNLVALAAVGTAGSTHTKTSYLTLKEMQCFLSGFNFCRNNAIQPKSKSHA